MEAENQVSLQEQKKRKRMAKLRNTWQLWIMALPAVVLIAIFNYVPMYGIQLAFRDFVYGGGILDGPWVGLKYFEQFFNSPMFGNVMINTIRLSLATLVFGFFAPILLALVLNQLMNSRVKNAMQTVVYLPHFISVVVMVGMIKVFLMPESGLLSNLLVHFGFGNNLLGEPGAFVPIYVISDIWQHCGWNSIIYLAALSNVDTQLYEAAKIDGASRFRIILSVELPAIVPTIVILLILNMGGILNSSFEKTYLLQNTLNMSVSETIATYTYKIGILQTQFSYSTAIGLFNTVINFICLMLTNTVSKAISESSLW